MKMGFIEDLTAFIDFHIPTQKTWSETVSIVTLSTVLQGIHFSTLLGPIQLNLFALCVGPSGLGHKTLPLKNVMLPILTTVEKIVNWRFLLPSKFSLEGMVEYMAESSSVGVIMSDEFTQVIKSYYGKDYLADLMEFLSELFDGQVQKRYTRKTKLEYSPKVYVSMISATTPYLYHVLSPDLFLQGTANRFLFVLFNEPVQKIYDPEEFFIPPSKSQEFAERIVGFGHELAMLRTIILRGGWIIGVTPEAAKLLMDYRGDCVNRANLMWMKSQPNDFEYSYVVRMPEMCFKLAGIKCVSDNMSRMGNTNVRELLITESQAKWAVERMRQYEAYFKKLLIDWVHYSVGKLEVKTMGSYVDLIVKTIQERGGSMTRSDLISRTRLKAQDLDAALQSSPDLVEMKVEKTHGRDKIVYRLLS